MISSCKVFPQLVINVGGRAQPIIGGAIPRLVVLGSIRKQAEPVAVAHTFNSSTQKQRQTDLYEFKASLVFKASRTTRATEKPCLRGRREGAD